MPVLLFARSRAYLATCLLYSRQTPGRTVMAVVMGLDDPTLRQPSTDAGTEAVDSMAAAAIQRTYDNSNLFVFSSCTCAPRRVSLELAGLFVTSTYRYRTHRSTVLAARFHVCAHQRQALLSETTSPLLALARALAHGVLMKSTKGQWHSLLACLAGAAAAVTALSVCASGTPAVTQVRSQYKYAPMVVSAMMYAI